MFVGNFNDRNGRFSIAKYCEDVRQRTQGKLFFAKKDIKCYDGLITAGSIVAIECIEKQNDIDMMLGVFDKEEAVKNAIYESDENAFLKKDHL